MKYSLYLGKILKVKIYVHWTFIFLIGWIALSSFGGDLGFKGFLWMTGLTLAAFACIVLHELGHAVVARRFKIQTKHITLLPVGGIAQLESIPQKPGQELLIASAGPAVNLLIAAMLVPFVNTHVLVQLDSLTTINSTNFFLTLIVINVWLAVFNLIPAFPMDGGRILRSLLAFWMDHAKATKIAAGIGQVFGLVFFFAGFFYSPMLLFIGLVIFLGGRYEFAFVDMTSLLKAFTVNDVLMREVPVMETGLTLRSAGNRLLGTQNRNFVVVEGDKPVGTISRDEIIHALNETGEDTLLDKVKNDALLYVQSSTPLDEAWTMLQNKKASLLLVKNNGHLDGVVDEDNVTEFILLKSGRRINRRV